MPILLAESLQPHQTLPLSIDGQNKDNHNYVNIITQPTPKAESSDKNKIMMPRRAHWLRRHYTTLRNRIRPRFQFLSPGDNCVRRIYIEVLVNDQFVCRPVMALFDTGCPRNLVSRTMASTLGVESLAFEGRPILDTLGTDKFRTLGQVERRWACDHSGFAPKFYDGVWEVSDKLEPYDVIIGLETMIANKLFKLSPALSASVSG